MRETIQGERKKRTQFFFLIQRKETKQESLRGSFEEESSPSGEAPSSISRKRKSTFKIQEAFSYLRWSSRKWCRMCGDCRRLWRKRQQKESLGGEIGENKEAEVESINKMNMELELGSVEFKTSSSMLSF